MIKDLKIAGWLAEGEVEQCEDGWNVVITIPFSLKETAEVCLNKLYHLREVSNDKRNL